MAWTDIFRSRYVRFLEAELNAARKNHVEEIEALKKTHAEERERCMLETNRAWGEVDRLRQYLLPGMPVADRNPQSSSNDAPQTPVDFTAIGTPWQRTQARYAKIQEEEARVEAATKKAAEPVQPS